MLACWAFMESDWDGTYSEKNVVHVDGADILQKITVQGHSFVARKDVMKRYLKPDAPHGIPIDRPQMSIDGLISGFPLPIQFAHNMDDPRSELCLTVQDGEFLPDAALTARVLKFETPQLYGQWIAKDAQETLHNPIGRQLWWAKLKRKNTLSARLQRKFLNTFRS